MGNGLEGFIASLLAFFFVDDLQAIQIDGDDRIDTIAIRTNLFIEGDAVQ